MTGILCPRCEKPVEGHDDAGCRRRMSRRFFFGLAAGAVVATQAAGAIEHKVIADLKVGDTMGVKIAMSRVYSFNERNHLWTAVIDFTIPDDGSIGRGRTTRFEVDSLEHPELGDRLAEAWAWDDWREKQQKERGED